MSNKLIYESDRADWRASIVTIALVIANVLVFVVQSLKGNIADSGYMIACGADYWPLTLSGEYWRLFTSMFMHFSLQHLASNMISLIAMGMIVEHALGYVKYLITYLVSGLAAGLVSCFYHRAVQAAVVSAGASGAIFGLTGAIAALAIFDRAGQYGIDKRRVPMAVLLSVLVGIESSVDTAAHIGGLAAGFLISFLILKISTSGRTET